MQISKAVVTAARQQQRNLPIQTLFDQHGKERSVLSLVVEEATSAGIEDICIVVWPGDEERYSRLLSEQPARLTFIGQREPRGYAHAVFCAREFVGDQPFLHFVGDHIYVDRDHNGCARELVEAAVRENSAISGVQVTHESQLPLYGTVGGRLISGKPGLYRVESVLEKPSPTQAEQQLSVPGLRSGHYLCFFGMHVFTPEVFEIISEMLEADKNARVNLSAALNELARREQYLAMIQNGRRFDVGVKYGLFTAQLALALSGQDRDQVMTELLNVLASRDLRGQQGAED